MRKELKLFYKVISVETLFGFYLLSELYIFSKNESHKKI